MSEEKAWGETVNSGWIDIQKRTFTKWCNSHLVDRMMKIGVLDKDLEDGVMLCALLEQISSKNLGLVNKKAKIRAQKLENNGAALRFLKDEGIKLVAIGPEDIVDGNLKLILGLIWTIILRYQIQKIGVQGSSAKSDLLAWVRKQIPEYNINNFKEDWRDGKALCALGESLKPGIVNLPAMAGRSPLENARTGSDAAEKELGIPPILQPEDLVSPDVDELSVMTYISYFRDYEQNHKKNMESEALARLVDPMKCIAFGPGLEHAEVGYDAEFTIQARNAAGKNITTGGETFDVQIKAPLNSPPVKAEVTDKGDGTYKVVYNPKAHGQHVISVNIQNKPIQNSPFRVNVDRLGLDPSQTDAFGPGLEGATAKQPTHFTIVAKNKKGDPVGAGGERFDIQIKGPYDSEIKHEVLDNKDGSYTVNYKPTEPGDLTVAINYEGKSVGKSPYHVKCESHPDASDAGKSEAYGPGLENIIAGEPANFTIQAKNKKGEKLTKGGDAFDVEVIGPDDLPLDVKVHDNKDGTYSVSYNPENPGKHKIDVVLRGENPLFYDHVKGSPKVLDAEAGTDPAKSLVFGPGVEDGLLDTLPANFTIQAKDRNGKDLGKGGDPFEVKVTDQNGKQIDAPITDNGDGTYNVQYQPTGAGRHKVDVRLKGKPVGNTPVSVNVKEGASWEHTGIESFSFVIRTKDKKGNNKSQGGELQNFSVTVTKQGGGDKIEPKVIDIGDGTYVVTYSVPGPGEYQIGAMLNGHHIKGSPWKQSA